MVRPVRERKADGAVGHDIDRRSGRFYNTGRTAARGRIEAAPARYLTCEKATDPDGCMRDGVAAFRTVWADALAAREARGE